MFLKKLWQKKGKTLKRISVGLWALLTVTSMLAAGYNANLVIGQHAQIEQMKQAALEGAEASRRADQYMRMLETHKDEDALWIALNMDLARLTEDEVAESDIPELLRTACNEYFVKDEYMLVRSMQVGGAVFIEIVGTPQEPGTENMGLALILYVVVFKEAGGWDLYGVRMQTWTTGTWAELQEAAQ